MDESTLRDPESVLITYVRCTKWYFAEEMLFYKSLESIMTAKDKQKNYLDVNNI
ncbi:unnamed protein product, partial [Lymnaea stagnalis]